MSMTRFTVALKVMLIAMLAAGCASAPATDVASEVAANLEEENADLFAKLPQLDRDGDGSVSREEFEAHFRPVGAKPERPRAEPKKDASSRPKGSGR